MHKFILSLLLTVLWLRVFRFLPCLPHNDELWPGIINQTHTSLSCLFVRVSYSNRKWNVTVTWNCESEALSPLNCFDLSVLLQQQKKKRKDGHRDHGPAYELPPGPQRRTRNYQGPLGPKIPKKSSPGVCFGPIKNSVGLGCCGLPAPPPSVWHRLETLASGSAAVCHLFW